MNMNRSAALIGLGVSAIILAGGLLFLCAATRQPSRLLLAIILLVVGAGLAVFSALTLRRLRELDPENLSDRITALAEVTPEAEVNLSQVVAELQVPDESALAALNLLQQKQQCRVEIRDGQTVYVFPGLKEKKLVRRCAYCGSTFSVKEPLHQCPHCGGEVELVRE
jgi:predicted RNA-binding Zn-ribbon protein involved in translation (DUF1610 family)